MTGSSERPCSPAGRSGLEAYYLARELIVYRVGMELREPACPKCEDTTQLGVFEEHRRSLVHPAGGARMFATAALAVWGATMLTQAQPVVGALLLAGAVLVAVRAVRAVRQARWTGWAQVLYCPRCLMRFRPEEQVTEMNGAKG